MNACAIESYPGSSPVVPQNYWYFAALGVPANTEPPVTRVARPQW